MSSSSRPETFPPSSSASWGLSPVPFLICVGGDDFWLVVVVGRVEDAAATSACSAVITMSSSASSKSGRASSSSEGLVIMEDELFRLRRFLPAIKSEDGDELQS